LANGGDGASACVAATGVSDGAGWGAGAVTVLMGGAGSDTASVCDGAAKFRAVVP